MSLTAKHIEMQQLIAAFDEFIEAVVNRGLSERSALDALLIDVSQAYKSACLRFILGVHDGGWDRVREKHLSDVRATTDVIRRYTEAVRSGTAYQVLNPALTAFVSAQARVALLDAATPETPEPKVPSAILDAYEMLIRVGDQFIDALEALGPEEIKKHKAIATKKHNLFNKARAILKQHVDGGYNDFQAPNVRKQFESHLRGIQKFTELLQRSEPTPAVKRNRVRCKVCSETIESKHQHDMVYCKCRAVGVDGGLEYRRIVGKPENYEIVS